MLLDFYNVLSISEINTVSQPRTTRRSDMYRDANSPVPADAIPALVDLLVDGCNNMMRNHNAFEDIERQASKTNLPDPCNVAVLVTVYGLYLDIYCSD